MAAAQEFGISLAYVSKRIAELERRLGVTLFHRTTRRVHLSTQGEAAYAWARRILADVDGLAIEMSNAQAVLVRTAAREHQPAPGTEPRAADPGPARQGATSKLEIWLELVNSRMDMIEEGIDNRPSTSTSASARSTSRI